MALKTSEVSTRIKSKIQKERNGGKDPLSVYREMRNAYKSLIGYSQKMSLVTEA
jgi:hypothetical protein